MSAASIVLVLGLWQAGGAVRGQGAGDAPAGAQAQAPDGQAADPVVARGDGLLVRASELEPVLLERYSFSSEGRDILKLLLRAEVLGDLGRERGVSISDDDVQRRWKELDDGLRASGDAGGLAGQIQSQGLSDEEFRDFLRLGLIQERLAREALGIPAGQKVTGDQQEVWLDQLMTDRGLQMLPPPWKDGVVAQCGAVRIGVARYGAFLRRRLPRDDVKETCWHLLLLKGIERRMPQIAPDALDAALDAEVERRRAKHEEEHPKVKFETYLAAQGRTLEGLKHDPSVRIATLSRLWVDRTAGPDGLREAYQKDRELFEGRYGEAVHTHLLFLVASRYKNQLNPRTFEEAEAQLDKFAKQVGNTDDFVALASRYSEEPTSRDRQGDMGWVTRAGDPRQVPPALRQALFARYDQDGKIPPQGELVGPVRLDTGAALCWISEHRDSPSWEEMSEHVNEELRRRFLVSVLPESDVQLQ